MKTKIVEEWEEEFDKKLPKMICDLVWCVTDGGCKMKEIRLLTYQEEPIREFEDIKSFISSQIAEAYKRGVSDSLEKVPKEIDYIWDNGECSVCGDTGDEIGEHPCSDKNKVLEQTREAIKELLK